MNHEFLYFAYIIRFVTLHVEYQKTVKEFPSPTLLLN